MYHIFFIHSSVSGHLSCYHILAIANSIEMKIGVHVSFQIKVLSGYMPRNRTAGSYGSSVFSILKISILIPIVVAPIYIPTKSLEGSLLSTSSPDIIVCGLFSSSFFFFFFFYFLFRVAPMACGGTQARSLIRATAACLHHSHARSEPHL